MFRLNREHGTTLVLVTHDVALASRCARRLSLAGRASGRRRARCASRRREHAPPRGAPACARLARRRAARADRGAACSRWQRRHRRILRRPREGRADDAGEPAARRRPADLRRSAAAATPSRTTRARGACARRRWSASTAWCSRRRGRRRARRRVLADVKAVGEGYPLRGAVMLADPAVPEGRAAQRHSRRRARRGSTTASPSACSSTVGDRMSRSATRRSPSARSCQQDPRSRAWRLPPVRSC